MVRGALEGRLANIADEFERNYNNSTYPKSTWNPILKGIVLILQVY